MKKIILICLIFITYNGYAQTSDFCFESKENWTSLHNLACINSLFTYSIGNAIAKDKSTTYKTPSRIVNNDINTRQDFDSAYLYNEQKDERYRGTVASFQMTSDMSFIVATNPYGKEGDGFNNAHVVALIKTGGECQILADGYYPKTKVNSSENKSVYLVKPITRNINYGGKEIKLQFTLFYKDGLFLKSIKMGEVTIDF